MRQTLVSGLAIGCFLAVAARPTATAVQPPVGCGTTALDGADPGAPFTFGPTGVVYSGGPDRSIVGIDRATGDAVFTATSPVEFDAITVSSTGEVAVLAGFGGARTSSPGRVVRFDPIGDQVGSFGVGVIDAASASIATDATGGLWVVDPLRGTIRVFGSDGTLVLDVTADPPLLNPSDVEVAPSGDVYVIDGVQQVVYRFDDGGAQIGTIPTGHIGSSKLAVDSLGRLYVTDPFRRAVHVLAPGGQPLASLRSDRFSPALASIRDAEPHPDGAIRVADGSSGSMFVVSVDVDLTSPEVRVGAVAQPSEVRLGEPTRLTITASTNGACPLGPFEWTAEASDGLQWANGASTAGPWVIDSIGPGVDAEQGTTATATCAGDQSMLAELSGPGVLSQVSVDVEVVATSAAVEVFQQVGCDIGGPHEPDWAQNPVTLSNDGNRVAIGEPYAFTGDQQTGRVRVFDWDGTTWSQTGATLAGTNMGQQFGYAVALSGDGSRIALSAPAVTPDMERPAGHVRVHEWDGGTWRQAGSDITEPDGGIREWGQSIAISDDGQVLAVGVTYTPGAPGRVYLSPWDGADWTATDRYLEGRARDDRFGASIALTRSGERIVIGAAGSIDVPGYVRVYQRDGATWRQFGDDFEIDANEADLSVAITDDGNRIAFSTPRSGSGRVRVHDWSGSAWEPAGSDIVDSTDSGFGRSLALSGDGNRIVISGESAIGVHDWDGIAWLQRATIDTQTPDVFSPPSLGISRDGSRFAVDRPRLRVYAGPVAEAPATTTTTSAAITIPPTGTGTAAGAGMLAAVLLLCGLTALATTRRGC